MNEMDRKVWVMWLNSGAVRAPFERFSVDRAEVIDLASQNYNVRPSWAGCSHETLAKCLVARVP